MRMTPQQQNYHVKRQCVAAMQGGFYCGYCRTREALELDHIIPTARGGTESLKNLVLACQRCNSRKLHYTNAELRKRGHKYIAIAVDQLLWARQNWNEDIIAVFLERLNLNLPLEGPEAKPKFRPLLSDFQTPLSQKIHEAIVEKRISRHRVRVDLGLAGWTIDRWCTGAAQPTPPMLKAFAEYIGKPLAYFLPDVNKHKNWKNLTPLQKRLVWCRWESGARNWEEYSLLLGMSNDIARRWLWNDKYEKLGKRTENALISHLKNYFKQNPAITSPY